MPLTLTKTDGSTLNIQNSTGASVSFTIRQLQDDGTFLTVLTTTVLTNGNQQDYTFGGDGVYQVVEDYVSDVITNVIIYNDIEVALLALMKIIHSDDDCCCSSKMSNLRLYYYNAIMANFYLFMAMINTTYVDNWIYTAVNTDELQNLLCISDVITKITELIAAADLLTDPCDDC